MDDARRLVEPLKEEDEEEETSFPPVDPPATQDDEQVGKENGSSDSLLNAIVGRKQSRDRSVDSAQSSGSGKRVAFAVEANSSFNKAGSPTSSSVSNEPLQTGNSAVGSMRSLGSTLNPLKGFGGMTVMRGFGRSTSSNNVTTTLPTAGQAPVQKDMTDTRISTIKTLPPIQRYMDAASVEDLKIGEVAGLLKDYKRLACALKDIGAF